MEKTSTRLNRRTMLRGAALGTIAAPALVGKAIAQGKVNWRVQSHWPKSSSSFDDSLGVLATQLEEQTDGAFKLETFGAGEFAKGPDIYNLVRKGVVPMGSISPSYVQDNAQAASFMFGIPGTFRDSWEMQHAVKNLGLEDMVNEELMPDGVMIRGEKVLPVEMVVSKTIESAEDFKGLKVRSSGTMLDYLQSAGAAPQYIPGSELYQSLASGVVDGAHWGAAVGANSMSLWEVCKYHVKPALGQTTDAWIVNMDALEGLDEDMRLIFEGLLEARFFRRSQEYLQAEAVALTDGVNNQGVEVLQLPDDVLALLADASSKILDAESQKGEIAARAADVYRKLMTDLGYL